MAKTASEIFAYNLKNLEATCKLRGENRKRVLGEMEFMRTHKWDPKLRKNKWGFMTGRWIERKKPIKKIKDFRCKKKK